MDKSEGRYHQLKKMTDMGRCSYLGGRGLRIADVGSRMQKLWFQVTGSDGSLKILALVSLDHPDTGC